MNIREVLEKIEHDTMVPQAAKSSDTRGRDREEPEDDLRPSYQRDRDRIASMLMWRMFREGVSMTHR